MCGISGFIDYKKDSEESILESMASVLTYRGPDATGFYYENTENFQLGLAHNRLSIIDLEASANQPMEWQDYVIVFNGEIYNFQEIKDELISLGHTFVTKCDTEVIIHAFDQWQHEAVQKFRGMFAFVLYDKSKNKIYLYRDRAGVKPLFYYWDGELFLFASELKAFHQHPRFKKELNHDALAMFLKYSYVPAPHCIFQHANKLLQGHFIEINIANPSIELNKYWDVNVAYQQEKLNISDSEAITETEKILQTSFDFRMVADVPIGVFLSGGYDSTAVAALLQKNKTQKLKTFTIGFHETQYNEAPYAKEIANYLGTDHTEYYCTPQEARELLPTLPFYYDEPFGDSSAIPTMLVSKMARQDVTVALSADGGDELFGGYNRHPIIQKMDKTVGRLPSFSRDMIYSLSGMVSPEVIPVLKEKKLIGQRYSKFRKLIKTANASSYLESMSSVVDDKTLSKLLHQDYQQLPTFFDEKIHGQSVLSEVLAMDYKTYLPDDILTKVDRATMSVSLEGREPFLDHTNIEWIARLPDTMKIRNGEKKWLLKQIVHQYIPKTMMDRPKAGFAIPIEEWFREDLRSYFGIYFDKLFIEEQGLFDYDIIATWLQKYQSGKKEYMTQLWNLLMFQMWYKKWME